MKRKIEELELKISKLENESKLKTDWISLISHDSKSVFGNLLWLIQAIEDKNLNQEDFFKMLLQIKNDVTKNLKTFQDTTQWLKTQSEEFALQHESINIFDLYLSLKEKHKERLLEKEINFNFKGEKDQVLVGDHFLVSFILDKLIDNAIKYSTRGQDIYFQSTTQKHHTIISIEDFGTGINKESLDSIFSFENAVYEGTEGELGAGLSLKIVKNFVSLADGSIEIESSKDKGTCVSILLPQT